MQTIRLITPSNIGIIDLLKLGIDEPVPIIWMRDGWIRFISADLVENELSVSRDWAKFRRLCVIPPRPRILWDQASPDVPPPSSNEGYDERYYTGE